MDVDVGTRDVDVAAQDQLAAFLVQLFRPRGKAGQEGDLCRIVLAAVGHVYGCEHEMPQRHLHDACLDVEFGMAELRHLQQLATKVQRHAGVTPAAAMPEHVVVGELAPLRNLVGPRLDLLQAHHIRPVALQPVA